MTDVVNQFAQLCPFHSLSKKEMWEAEGKQGGGINIQVPLHYIILQSLAQVANWLVTFDCLVHKLEVKISQFPNTKNLMMHESKKKERRKTQGSP